VVMTRTADAGPKGVTALLVPADAEGIEYGKKEHKMGWNAQPTRMITSIMCVFRSRTAWVKKARVLP